MSVLGTAASFAGGVLVGIAMALDLWIEGAGCLVLEQSGMFLPQLFLLLGIYGGFGGAMGSLVSVDTKCFFVSLSSQDHNHADRFPSGGHRAAQRLFKVL